MCVYTHTVSLKNGKESASNVGDMVSIPGSGRFPGEGNGNPLKYSCLENPMDRKACWVTVHGVAKESDTMQQLNTNIHIHIIMKGKKYILSTSLEKDGRRYGGRIKCL